MPIQVHCPNGHLLTCPDERAGKHGKCPRCGAVVEIPEPSGWQIEEEQPEEAPEDSAEPATAETATTFWFLCPNGHKLNGPLTLAGRAGKCPHCDARFIIPSPEDYEEEAEEQLSFEMVEEEPAEEVATAPTKEPVEFDFRGIDSVDPATRPTARPPVMAALFNELWRKSGEGIVELHLRGGAMLVPNWYNTELSQGRVAVLGMQEIDGTYSVAIVPWDTVERIAVRGMELMPRGLFE
jgi:hypothetical protein